MAAKADSSISIGSSSQEEQLRKWELRRLVKRLESFTGQGTSVISLIVPSGGQIVRTTKMLNEELHTASNIKNRLNRQSVQSAITSALQKLKLYRCVPSNGLVLYSGEVEDENGKAKKILLDYEPFRSINRPLYLCDSKFHVGELKKLLEEDEVFGFIVVDGHGALFATISGNTKKILHKMGVSLPPKHGRGGQSAQRFARIREEKRRNYMKKVAEISSHLYVDDTGIRVSGLILAGSADFKAELAKGGLLDYRLQRKVLKLVDVAYGGENGLHQAIELSQDVLSGLRLVREKQIIGRFFEELAKGSQVVCYGVREMMRCLEMGVVDTLIVWEDLGLSRCVIRDGAGDVHVEFVMPGFSKRPRIGGEEIIEEVDFVEWAVVNSGSQGIQLEIVSNESAEGSQFCKSFGGLGALLRFPVPDLDLDEDDDSM